MKCEEPKLQKQPTNKGASPDFGASRLFHIAGIPFNHLRIANHRVVHTRLLTFIIHHHNISTFTASFSIILYRHKTLTLHVLIPLALPMFLYITVCQVFVSCCQGTKILFWSHLCAKTHVNVQNPTVRGI